MRKRGNGIKGKHYHFSIANMAIKNALLNAKSKIAQGWLMVLLKLVRMNCQSTARMSGNLCEGTEVQLVSYYFRRYSDDE